MVNSKVFEENHDLMVTYTDDPTKTLHKVGTDEYYDDPIDLIIGQYTEGERAGQPKGLYEYEEVDRPEEPKVTPEEATPQDMPIEENETEF